MTTQLPSKPDAMFDRGAEWAALARFATDAGAGATLGVVSGRRRQGKTYLLRALCQATGGFYFAAEEAADSESLRRMGAALADYSRSPAPFAFPDWRDAVDALLAIGRERPVPVVIDEFPYLARTNQSLPSVIQNALAPLRAERDDSRSRLLLCGSAMSFMGTLLSGSAPLRGRASLELGVHAFDHRLAADFWGIRDPHLAIKVNAVLGGTPAYRREFVRDDVPRDADDFDAWITRTVLSPASPLFREARYLLADDLELRDAAVYHSVLAAIAGGNATRGGIASFLDRKSGDLAHPLAVLEDAGLIAHKPDTLRDKRTTFWITEPLVNFYHAVMRPIWSDLEHSPDTHRLWQRSRRRFDTLVLGPHFEHLCREWTRHMAPHDMLGGVPHEVGSTVVNDPGARTTHEVDVVALGLSDNGRTTLLGVGEAKWNEVMGHRHLDRLRHIRGLLTAKGVEGAAAATVACFSGAGFTEELRAEAQRSSDIRLVTAGDLYT